MGGRLWEVVRFPDLNKLVVLRGPLARNAATFYCYGTFPCMQVRSETRALQAVGPGRKEP